MKMITYGHAYVFIKLANQPSGILWGILGDTEKYRG